jgi:hypothetical protein
VLLGLLTSIALCAELPTVALLPLDGTPGTSSAGASQTVRGIAAAIQKEGGVVPLYDTELAQRLGAGSEERLADAREALSEGRRLLAEGDADLALAFLEEAVNAHRDAGSDVVRRGEAADAHYSFGRALLRTYERDRARAEIRRAILLVPDYMGSRADAVDPDIAALAAEAEKSLRDRPPRRLTTEGAAQVGADLKVDFVVHGAVEADGKLVLTVQEGSDKLYTVERMGPFAPPIVGDPWYDGIARQIVAACLHETIPQVTEQPRVAVVEAPPDGAPPPPPPDPPPDEKPPEDPRGGTWWVWASAGVLAAGGAGAIVYATLPQPEPDAPEPVWSVAVTPP